MFDATTIPRLLESQATERRDEPAIGGLRRPPTSYRDLDALTQGAAETLTRFGVRAGDRVAIVLPNGPEMATALLSVVRAATAAPLNPLLTRSELAFYLDDLAARAVIVADDDATAGSDAARDLEIPVVTLRPDRGATAGVFALSAPTTEIADRSSTGAASMVARPSDAALVLHTSGTTARPKIVPLTHENLCRSAGNVARTLELGPDDRCLNVMPLFHIHGLVAALLASLAGGGSVVCTPGFEAPSFFEWVEQTAPTWYTAVPTMHQAILARAGAAQRDLIRGSALRLIRSSSASLPPSVLGDVEEAFAVPVLEAYGMTEAAHQIACNPLPPSPRRPGSVGLAAGPEVAIADAGGRFLAATEVGEVVIRGSNVTPGYHGMVDQSASFFGDGWFRTGDLGFLDSDGYLFLTGRLKEIINRGGESIAPRGIDEALLEHPSVMQAVAFAVPDPQLGEEVAAAVVLASGADETESTLQDFLVSDLSWGRMPKRILIVDEIPTGATGKIQRIGLAERLGLATVRQQPSDVDAVGKATNSSPNGASEETTGRVAALWHAVLKDSDIGPDDPFLDVGGDSVTATSLVIRVEEEFSVKLPLMEFFNATTIRGQADLIDRVLADQPADG